jgi:hypothetical protein
MILSYEDWMAATAHEGNLLEKVRKGRGRIVRIDVVLKAWHENKNKSADLRTAALVDILKECYMWNANKTKEAAKKSTSKRLEAVKALWKDAMDELTVLHTLGLGVTLEAHTKFETRKATGRTHGNLARMKQVYAHERKAYEQSGKTRAPSATALHDKFDEQKEAGQFKKLDYKDISFKQFRELDRLAGEKKNVIYLSKSQRLQYIAWPANNGLLCRADGSLVVVGKGKMWIYAADKYGNFFTADHRMLGAATELVNHSSLNAGKDVLCAGWIITDQGLLTMINNNSGHYKPTPTHLRRLLLALDAEGLDLRHCEVDVYTLDSQKRTVATTYDAIPWMNNPGTAPAKGTQVMS